MKSTERLIQQSVREYLEWNKWQVWKLTIPRYSKGRGLPDLLAIKGDKMLFLEVKGGSKYYGLRDEQKVFFDSLKKIRKVEGYQVKSVDEIKELK